MNRCDVCLKKKKLSQLREVSIWHTLKRDEKHTLILHGGKEMETDWAADDCEKVILVCKDCILNLNFREYKK